MTFAEGGFAEMDGVIGAVMVTCHTVGAVSMPKRTKSLFDTPIWVGVVARHGDVAQRTHFGT